MEIERFVLLEQKNGVKYAVRKERGSSDINTEEKVKKLEQLLKLLVKQSVAQTIEEYHIILKEELLRSEEKLELLFRENREFQEKQWKTMEEHFTKVDKSIREKQREGKRSRLEKYKKKLL